MEYPTVERLFFKMSFDCSSRLGFYVIEGVDFMLLITRPQALEGVAQAFEGVVTCSRRCDCRGLKAWLHALEGLAYCNFEDDLLVLQSISLL